MKQILTVDSKVRELLKYTVLQYMLDTLSENPKLGRIFVDDEINPNTCILCLKHMLFFGGTPSQECLDFLFNQIVTDDDRKKGQVFYLLYKDETWKTALMEVFSDKCVQYERSLYMCKPEFKVEQPGSENIVEITSRLMNSATGNLGMITDEVIGTGTYNDMEDYLNRGVGYTPVINNKVCGFCTSEYPSKDTLAIGIEVLEEYQRQGYAKSMTKLFLSKAAQWGVTVYWECWKNNIASVNTALSCQFEKVADYPILFVRL